MDAVKYPDVTVELLGQDGNALVIMGAVRRELKRHLRESGSQPAEIAREVDEFSAEAMSGDYDHLLQTCMAWVNVE